MKFRRTIDPSWSEYDKTVARGQLATFGIICLDVFGCPLDDEWLDPNEIEEEEQDEGFTCILG